VIIFGEDENEDGSKKRAGGIDDEPAVLCTAADGSEAMVLTSLLMSLGIPSSKRYKGIGDSVAIFMGMGGQAQCVDILVPARLLDAAREALAYKTAPDEGEISPADNDEPENAVTNDYRKSPAYTRRVVARWFLFIFAFFLILGMILALVRW